MVPYDPSLLKEFMCHINVEICSSIKAIKYIIKYINKGKDMAIFLVASDGTETQIQDDEIRRYLLGRYLGPCSGMATLLGDHVHER